MQTVSTGATAHWLAAPTFVLILVVVLALVSFFIHLDNEQARPDPLQSQPWLPTVFAAR